MRPNFGVGRAAGRVAVAAAVRVSVVSALSRSRMRKALPQAHLAGPTSLSFEHVFALRKLDSAAANLMHGFRKARAFLFRRVQNVSRDLLPCLSNDSAQAPPDCGPSAAPARTIRSGSVHVLSSRAQGSCPSSRCQSPVRSPEAARSARFPASPQLLRRDRSRFGASNSPHLRRALPGPTLQP